MKKTLAILLSAVMMLGLLAGCGSKTTEQPSTSGTENTETAALNAGKYISAMGFDTTLAAPVISFVSMGVWAPVNWLLLLCITLLAITIAAGSFIMQIILAKTAKIEPEL